MKLYDWRQIGTIPADGGVYAWYFTPKLSTKDVNSLIEAVNQYKTASDEVSGRLAVQDFLNEHIFRYFTEQPYNASISGPLKPLYQGVLEHNSPLSTSLVERILADPNRLDTINRILESSVPNFSSPIYIGMSGNLFQRLSKHKALIEKYRQTPGLLLSTSGVDEEGRRDHSFAQEICTRGIPPSLLSVSVQVVPGVAQEWVDVENILNRIHFPLFGRN